MNGEFLSIEFFNSWAWLIAIGAGLVLIILELLVGVDTGLDLVFIGTAFGLGGLITLGLKSWVWTIIIVGIICVIYVVLGRRYIHKRTAVPLSKTNIDTIIGKVGIVEKDIERANDGLVKIDHEKWRARADDPIKAGEEITVVDIKGVTLVVKKSERSLA
ncbi:MAG: NfeD family protein [Dehalococcoidales bacterium]|nr:NfeD family protein [Dehalococcoidales bacterium]